MELLQAGRALAALSVIFCHAGLYSGGLFYYGFLGVDFFFVLSGFIIYRVTASRPFDFGKFAASRLRRIFLPYWPVGIFCVVAYFALGRDFSPLASLALLPGQPALTVAWSLQHELVFYLLAACFFAARAPFTGASIWAAAILLRWLDPDPLGPWEGSLLSPRNLEFVIGMCLARKLTIPAVSIGPVLNFLGDASFSLYLVHLPVMGLLWRLGADFSLLVLGSVAAGTGYYLLVEKPLLRRKKTVRPKPREQGVDGDPSFGVHGGAA